MFSKRLKALRLENSFTQKDLADVLGIDRSTYSYYESARTRPDIESVVVIARLFKVSTDYLLTGKEHQQTVNLGEKQASYERSNVHSGDLAKDERQLLLYYRMLNSSDKTSIREETKKMYEEITKEFDE